MQKHRFSVATENTQAHTHAHGKEPGTQAQMRIMAQAWVGDWLLQTRGESQQED